MYYELYIDLFFLVNFMMDFFVLSVSKKILKCPATYGSISLGSMIGAALTTVLLILPISYSFIKFMIFHGLISILMIKTGLRVEWNKRFIKVYVVVYISAFLIGGVFSSLKQYIREMSTFFLFSFVSYFVSLGMWNYISYMRKYKNINCEVLLINGQKKVKANAIIDTGNCLRDSVTGKPVSIISKKLANELWQEFPQKGLRYIPYHTIGKKDGILPVLQLDEMWLRLDEKVRIFRILVAIIDEPIGTGEYDMILNPDVRWEDYSYDFEV